MNRQVGSYDEDNSKTARFEGDDVGLPENPIYSNFSGHLWKAHGRLGGVQTSDRFRENTDGRGPARASRRPAKVESMKVGEWGGRR